MSWRLRAPLRLAGCQTFLRPGAACASRKRRTAGRVDPAGKVSQGRRRCLRPTSRGRVDGIGCAARGETLPAWNHAGGAAECAARASASEVAVPAGSALWPAVTAQAHERESCPGAESRFIYGGGCVSACVVSCGRACDALFPSSLHPQCGSVGQSGHFDTQG